MSEKLEQGVSDINEKLDRIVKLLALSSINPDQSLKEKAIALSSVGLTSKEISDLLGSTAHSISQTLSAARKASKKKSKKKRAKKN